MRLDSSMNKRPPGGWRISMKHGFLQKLSGSTVQLLIYQHGFVIFCYEIRVQLWKLSFIIHFRRIFQYKPSSYLVYPHDYMEPSKSRRIFQRWTRMVLRKIRRMSRMTWMITWVLYLVGGLQPWNFMTFHILGRIIPTDELHHFSEGYRYTTNQVHRCT